MRPLRVLALAASFVLASAPAPAVDFVRPGNAPAVVPVPQQPSPFVQPAPSWCWLSVRLFDTLRHGPFDYCRRKLRYTPGKLECYTFTDQVCSVLLPSGEWTETRNVVQRQPIPCPRGPEPPVCRRLDLMGVGPP
ncbi:MAG: hypothetical protein KIT14_01035 [bacterium]|nr:hypothetical protein [bacterium]